MVMELKRAKEGTPVLTVQWELNQAQLADLELHGLDHFVTNFARNSKVAFLDRPARGAVVVDYKSRVRDEVAGPAEWMFEAPGPAQRAPEVAAARDDRFNGKPWFEAPVPAVDARDARFALAEVK